MKDFGQAVALVTGGANGIGLGLAKALAGAGMKVAIADLDQALAERVAGELRAQGMTAMPIVMDVRDRDAWVRVVDQVEGELGPLQILCSNAGVGGSKQPIEHTEWEGWRWTMDANLDSNFHAFKTCLPRMRKHGLPSHIVCTASMGGLLSIAGNGVYSATKAALISLCETVAQEVRDSNIGVSVLCPGLVRTALLENREKLKPGNLAIGSLGPEVEAGLKAGMDPDRVGEQVLAWMREGRFWMFTHPELRPYVQARNEAMLSALAG